MSNPLELVRVKDPTTGAEFNATRQYASAAGFDVTNKDTHDAYGRAIPLKSDPLKGDDKSAAKSAKKES
jgi:hypothetical protein